MHRAGRWRRPGRRSAPGTRAASSAADRTISGPRRSRAGARAGAATVGAPAGGRPGPPPARTASTATGARATHRVGGEGAQVGAPAGGVVEHRGHLEGPHRLGRVARSPGRQPARLLSTMGTNQTATATAPAPPWPPPGPTVRVEPTTASRARMAKAWMIDWRKPVRRPRATTRRSAVPAPGSGPPGQHDQQEGAGQGVEGVGGHDRAAEPGERRGGHHHAGGHAQPPAADGPSRHRRQPGGGGRGQRRHQHQAVDGAEPGEPWTHRPAST